MSVYGGSVAGTPMLPRPSGSSNGYSRRRNSSARSPHPLSEPVGADPGSVVIGSEPYDPIEDVSAAQARGGPGARRSQIPKVVDQTGETVGMRFEDFLESFVEDPLFLPGMTPGMTPSSSAQNNRFYISQIHGMKLYGLSTLYVDFKHLSSHEDGVLASAIASEYYRFHPYLLKALQKLLEKYEPEYYRQYQEQQSVVPGLEGRSAAATAGSGSGAGTTQSQSHVGNDDSAFNPASGKIFSIAFYNLPLVTRIRFLRTNQIGKLLSISGTVTRTSEVRPELTVATFHCQVCNAVVSGVEQSFRYTEPTQCPNPVCGNRQSWRLDLRQSAFTDWQKVRIQENSNEIPTGSMPRTMDVILRGEIVDRSKAGEKCIFTGTLIVIPDVSQFRIPGVKAQAKRDAGHAMDRDTNSGVRGIKGLGVRDLTYKMAFLACMVTPDGSSAEQAATQNMVGQSGNILASLGQTQLGDLGSMSGPEAQQEYLSTLLPEEIEDLKEMVSRPNIFERLVDSIAPTVYGHQVIKKGILLQLLGGVSKTTPEGMALRGDINICIVGDPSTSKSQFLKYVTSFWPRSVYTSGKASSAAGLTAAVVKDEETGEFTIEAGALMLADNGICAIDEFDKMDISDQVAIHEAMEQQTISIAKAGIHATLNARASILAAANPIGGRYNRKMTLRANINMSAPIMSRFDLFFVVLDECDRNVDARLADHIVKLHMLQDVAIEPEYSTEQLQRYIRFARTFRPEFTPEAKTLLVEKYKELRQDDAQGGVGRNSYRITVRQLESMIRLSEAIAKANCVVAVTPDFVMEAYGLLRQSIISVDKDDVEISDGEEDEGAEDAAAEEDDEHGEEQDEEHDEAEAEAEADRMDVDDGHVGGSTARTAPPTATATTTTTAAASAPAATPAKPKKTTKITYDKYRHILNLFVARLNQDQTVAEDGVAEDELLMWYLEQQDAAGQLDSADDVEHERRLAKKVLARLVKDKIVLRLEGDGLLDLGEGAEAGRSGEQSQAQSQGQGQGQDGGRSGGEGRRTAVYVLHPNVALEDLP